MVVKMGKIGKAALAGSMVVAGPVVAACATGPTYDEWASTDGAAGRINLDDVQAAFKVSKSATDFEKRVNRIYEGDGLVLIRAKKEGDADVIEAYEDLNGNNKIDDTQDDLLFSIENQGENNTLRGHGANGYYSRPFGGGSFLLGYMLATTLSPRGYYYNTSPGYANTTLRSDRNGFRGTSRYRSQVSRNSRYFSTRGGFSQSRYNSAGRNASTARQTYQSRQRSTGAFKSSGTGVRSSWGGGRLGGSRGFSGGRGGFRGGGGGQTIIGAARG